MKMSVFNKNHTENFKGKLFMGSLRHFLGTAGLGGGGGGGGGVISQNPEEEFLK